MSKRLPKIAVTTLLTFSTLFLGAGLTNTALAEESTKTAPAADHVNVGEIDESTAMIEIDQVTFDVDDEGNATATNKLTGKMEKLPEDGVDKDGNAIKYVYQTDGDTLQFQAVNAMVPEVNWAKCATGAAGGAAVGAGTLGIAGASAGTLTLPVIGTVGGGAVGTAVGAVGGGLTGAAANCF